MTANPFARAAQAAGNATATGIPAAQHAADASCDVNRKRSLFLDFLEATLLSTGGPNGAGGAPGADDDSLLVELLKQAPVPAAAELINDLPGVLTASPAAAAAAAAAAGPPDGQLAADHEQQPSAAAAGAADKQPGGHAHHRAVITAMPPATTRAAAAAGGCDNDDDTASVVTLPMPSRKRGRGEDEEDEACSSPNDLVEVPAAPAGKQPRSSAAGGRASSGGGGAAARHGDAAPGRDQQHSGAAAAAASTPASSPDTRKGILVAKVLTKSDASSKRIILPRIAVETNLPQLGPSVAQVFHFNATDPAGAVWPLVIKAWANGSNPKPVYVLEQVGEVLKAHRLTVGDAVALLADEEGRFYLEWNTPGAAAAASRPTFSGIVFKPKQQQDAAPAAASEPQQQQQPAAAPRAQQGAAAEAAPAGGAPAAAPAKQQQEQQPPQATTAATPAPAPQQAATPAAAPARRQQPAAAPRQEAPAPAQQLQHVVVQPVLMAGRLPSVALPDIEQTQQLPQHLTQRGGAAPGGAQQQQQQHEQAGPSAVAPPPPASGGADASYYMTAVPVTSTQVPGTFIPTSPCQLLVMGHMPMPDLDLDLEGAGGASGPQPSLPASLLASGGAGAGLEPASGSEDALLVPTAGGQCGAAGSVLMCPRTLGCTRPAGHQGWCLGHKGYKKRRA